MNILYVVGSCLQKNTSANMSHNSYIQGLIECGHNVDIIMAKDSFGTFDKSFPKFEKAKYYEFDHTPKIDYLRDKIKNVLNPEKVQKIDCKNSIKDNNYEKNKEISLFMLAKKIYNSIFIRDNLYALDRKWLKSASHFKSDINYDYIISNSSPASGHKLVSKIRKKIKYKAWIQIWEDPWYYDIYGNKDNKIYNEEKELLSLADKIFYVSPLTLEYQKKLFKDYSYKMDVVPLPYFKIENKIKTTEISYGYFGDYYKKTRNLRPFYQALVETKSRGYIYGNSDEGFQSNELIKISERVTVDELSLVQDNTSVLVCLCNLKGGQIPGKIYHYSATKKPIIFILDGTDEEKSIIRSYFGKFDRYYFCDNNIEDIKSLIMNINKHKLEMEKEIIMEFSPKNVVKLLLEKSSNLIK